MWKTSNLLLIKRGSSPFFRSNTGTTAPNDIRLGTSIAPLKHFEILNGMSAEYNHQLAAFADASHQPLSIQKTFIWDRGAEVPELLNQREKNTKRMTSSCGKLPARNCPLPEVGEVCCSSSSCRGWSGQPRSSNGFCLPLK
jgi:hypothetical protein